MKYFKTYYHVDLLYILHSGIGSYSCTPYTCLFFRWHLIMCHLITGIWWDILNSSMVRGWSAFLWIFQENCKLEEAETHRLHLWQCDATPMHSEQQHSTSKHRAYKQTGTTTIFSFWYQSCTWKRSSPSFRKKTRSCCNSGINLVAVLEYTFLQLYSNGEQIS